MSGRLIIYEFDSHEELANACRLLNNKGQEYRAYSPIPEDDLILLRGDKSKILSRLAVIGGLTGLVTAFAIQYYANVIQYPINIGGKPLNSWPAFMIICFELTILFSSFGILAGYIFVQGYPRFDREIFALKEFNERRDTHFFLSTKKEVTLDKAINRFDLPL